MQHIEMDNNKNKIEEVQKGQIVLPQPVLDRSLIDNVTKFINEVVPSAAIISSSFDGGASAITSSNVTVSNNQQDVILWAQFQRIDHEFLSWTGVARMTQLATGESATVTPVTTTVRKENISPPSTLLGCGTTAATTTTTTTTTNAATSFKTSTNRSASFDFFNSFSSYPLVLVLAYTNGLQIWAVEINGKAIEVLSWRHGNAKLVRLLPTPMINVNQSKDLDTFSKQRPLIAIHDHSLHQQIHCLHFVSLTTGETVKVVKFRNAIVDIQVNKKIIAVSFNEVIMIFDLVTLEYKITIKSCYPSPGLISNPISLGSRWLAFADCNLNQSLCSYGGMEGDSGKSYTTTVLNAAKTISSHILGFGGTVASHIAGVSSAAYKSAPSIISSNTAGYVQEQTSKSLLSSSSLSSSSSPSLSPPKISGTAQSDSSSPLSRSPASPCDNPKAGLVTIVDVNNVHNTNVKKTINDSDVVAHFVAHTDAIVQLQFDRSGQLLFCADQNGHDFNIFQIHSNTFGSQVATIHHLYVLHRGDTTARVQDVCFSHDSRWIAVSTIRGTSHVFSITPYGGEVSARTHCSKVVVNRISLYQQSAGLSTMESRSNGPLPDNMQSLAIPYLNPRLGPLPQPVILYPMQQIRPPISLQYLNSGVIHRNNSSGRQRLSSLSEDNSTSSDLSSTPRLTACFALSRNFPSDFGSPNLSLSQSQKSIFHSKQNERQLLQQHQLEQQQLQKQKYSESLFVFSSIGLLTQYDLIPKPSLSANKEPICDTTPIDLNVYQKARWILSRSSNDPDLKPPLAHNNILMKHLAPQNDLVFQSQQSISDNWVSQIEINSHMEPTRRLWMGPQFIFKICNNEKIKSLATKEFMECETVDLSVRLSQLKMNEKPATERDDVSSGIEIGTEQFYGSEPGLKDESFKSSDSQLSESFDETVPIDLQFSPVSLYTDKRDENYQLNQEEKTSSTKAENKEDTVDKTVNLPSLLQSSMPISKSTEVLEQKGEEGVRSNIGGTILTAEKTSNSPTTVVDRLSHNKLVLSVDPSTVLKKSKSKLGVKISDLDFVSLEKDNKNSSTIDEDESLPSSTVEAVTQPKTETDNDVDDEDYDNIKLEESVDYDDNCDNEKRPSSNLVKKGKAQKLDAAAVATSTATEDDLKLSKKRSRRNKRH